MSFIFRRNGLIYIVLIIFFPFVSFAQSEPKKERKGEFYFSWGYNTEWYTNSTVGVTQSALGNDYELVSVKGHDHRGWDEVFFHEELTIPQYNLRAGYFFNKKKNLAIEINFDHTKYIIADGQQAHLKGTLNSDYADKTINFSNTEGFYYYLNNGANFLLFNLVKRWNVIKSKNEEGHFKLDVLGKAGIGPVIPHVQNAFFGKANSPHFQFGGWNMGIEGAIRATFFKYIYLEYANKLDYARYSNLKIYEGTAKQAFGVYEMILNLGVTFPMGKRTETNNKEETK